MELRMNDVLNSLRNEQDTAWKEILDVYFENCISYCLPHLSKLINWKIPPLSLDKEFQAISKGAKSGKRLLDKLYKVILKNGCEQWVLVHIEVQGKPEDDFPKRMFTYGYRIWDKYQQPLVSCAILTDGNKSWRPYSYKTGFAGSSLRATFLTIKLIDYREKIAELEASTNPFANVIFVQLKALEIQGTSDDHRKNTKFMLTKRLYEKGFGKQEICNLYKFIDWVIGLPKDLEIKYLETVYQLEEESMPYISSAERFGLERGMEKGMEKGIEKEKIETAKRLLEEKVDLEFVVKITKLPLETIKTLCISNAV